MSETPQRSKFLKIMNVATLVTGVVFLGVAYCYGLFGWFLGGIVLLYVTVEYWELGK